MSTATQEPTFVQTQHGRTRYQLEGNLDSTELLVCVHGIGSAAYTFDYFAKFAVSQGFLVLRLDLYGRGLSDNAPKNVKHTTELYNSQIYQLLEHLKFAPNENKDKVITVIGHSMGGGVVTAFADQYSEIVDNLILMTPACTPFKMPPGSGLVKFKGLGELLFKINNKVNTPYSILSNEFYKKKDHEHTIKWLVEERSKMNQKNLDESFLNCVRNFPLTGQTEAVKRLGKLTNTRILVVWAMYDTTVPPHECFPVFWDAMKGNSQFAVFSDTKHIFNLERIDDSNHLMLNFVKQRTDPSLALDQNVVKVEYGEPEESQYDEMYKFWRAFEKKVDPNDANKLLIV